MANRTRCLRRCRRRCLLHLKIPHGESKERTQLETQRLPHVAVLAAAEADGPATCRRRQMFQRVARKHINEKLSDDCETGCKLDVQKTSGAHGDGVGEAENWRTCGD